MKLVTSINGRIVRRGQDKISVFDNSLLYAEGLFETLLVVDNRLMFVDDHLDRMKRGARLIGFEMPVDRKKLISWMNKTARAHPARIKKLRITFTAGESKRWTGRQGKSQIIMNAAPHVLPLTPYRIHLSPFRIDQASEFRKIKTISYAIHAAAIREAQKKNCDDALLLNQEGQAAEVTSANLFWVKKNQLYTPPLDSGCLKGTTRKIVISEARKLGISIAEEAVTFPNLLRADELFISSSLKLVIGVCSIKEGRRIHRFAAGPVTELLHKRFHHIVGA